MNSNSGTTLIELVLATVLVTVVVITLSAVFPKASKNISNNQQRLIANNLASAQVDTLISEPYANVNATDPNLFAASTLLCDCRVDDFSVLPSSFIVTTAATFNVKSCVHFVSPGAGNTWPSRCPAAGDSGYKVILARVFWTNGNQTYSVSQQNLKILH